MAASEAAKEAVYLGSFLGELEQHDNSPIDLRLDNKAAGDLAYNPEHHPKTKHIDRRHFYVRELVETGELVVPRTLRRTMTWRTSLPKLCLLSASLRCVIKS